MYSRMGNKAHIISELKEICLLCRGHFGGLVGGALIAFLLGPKLQVKASTQGRKYIVDSPPIPLLASPPIRIS